MSCTFPTVGDNFSLRVKRHELFFGGFVKEPKCHGKVELHVEVDAFRVTEHLAQATPDLLRILLVRFPCFAFRIPQIL
jgi:hypothetical protein